MPGSVAEVLGDLSKALRDLRIAWYVFGAQALVLRGFPRATAGLDVTVGHEGAGRPKDIEDAATLLAGRADQIDIEELNGLAKDLASAPAEDDRPVHLREATRRASRLRGRARAKPHRG
jgi:hypothetical protein